MSRDLSRAGRVRLLFRLAPCNSVNLVRITVWMGRERDPDYRNTLRERGPGSVSQPPSLSLELSVNEGAAQLAGCSLRQLVTATCLPQKLPSC